MNFKHTKTRMLPGLLNTLPSLWQRTRPDGLNLLSFAFAIWTLLCNLGVACGFGLRPIFLTTIAAGVISVLIFLCTWRRAGSDVTVEVKTPSAERTHTSLRWHATLLVGAAPVVVLAYAATGNIIFFWWAVVGYLLVVLIAEVGWQGEVGTIPVAEKTGDIWIWLVAVTCGVLALIAHRPDADDALYLSLAADAADDPRAPLLHWDTLHGVPGMPILMPLYPVHALEPLVGAVSWFTGIPVIYISHLLVAAVAGFLVPFAYARLFKLLLPACWFWAVVAVVVLLIVSGDTHRSFGNFSFVRLHQGKGIVVTVLVPLIIAFALEYMRRPSLNGWALLGAAQIAAVGTSSTALLVAPAVSALALASGDMRDRAGLRALAGGLLASTYPIVVGIALLAGTGDAVVALGWSAKEADALMSDALRRVFGTSALLYFSLFVLLASWFFVRTPLARRIAIVFPFGFLLLFFNPYLAPVIAAHATTNESYWRVFWVVPLPALTAFVLTAPLVFGEGRICYRYRALSFGLSLVLFTVLIPTRSTLSPENRVWFSVTTPKAPPSRRVAAIVNDYAIKGSFVLVPPPVAEWVTTFHHHPHPIFTRALYLNMLRSRLGDREVARRKQLARYVDGKMRAPGVMDILRGALLHYPLRVVCIRSNSRWADEMRKLLAGAGYQNKAATEGFEVWVKVQA